MKDEAQMKCQSCGNEFEGKCCPLCGTVPNSPDAGWIFAKSVKAVMEAGQASPSLLQRRCGLEYAQAVRILDEMEQRGFIGPPLDNKPRALLLTYEQAVEQYPDILAFHEKQSTKWFETSRKASFQIQTAVYKIVAWLFEPIPFAIYLAWLLGAYFSSPEPSPLIWPSVTLAFLIMRGIYETATRKKAVARRIRRKQRTLNFIRKKWGIEPPQPPVSSLPASSAPQALSLDAMDGHEFEHYCAELLRQNGFENVEVTQASGDYGIDVLAEKDGVTYAIQCKCYSDNVGNHAVQEAHSGASYYGRMVAAVMTNRYFTAAAKETAARIHVLLWDRDKLLQMQQTQNK